MLKASTARIGPMKMAAVIAASTDLSWVFGEKRLTSAIPPKSPMT